jgi:secondary thiamine-phosphate synthase enzyme
MEELVVRTRQKREIVDVTDRVEAIVSEAGKKDGLATVFVTHTTAAVTTADLDPGGTDQDYLDAFERMVPKLSYRHPHDPSHMPDHILASLIGPSLAVPFRDGELVLGTWQRIVLVELDGPRDRRLIVSV